MTVAEFLSTPVLVESLKDMDKHREHMPLLQTIFACEHCQVLLGRVIKLQLQKAGIDPAILGDV
jgi:hypothetical protein